MPVYSMTGYASGQHGGAGASDTPASWADAPVRLGLELRSVNSRFLDLSFRLPDELRQHEPALRELLSQQLRRGKVELRAQLDTRGGAALADVPAPLLRRLAALQEQVRRWLPEAPALSVADTLQWASREGGSGAAHDEQLLPLARAVLDDLLLARSREGERLAGLLRERLQQLRALARQAAPLVPQAVAAQKERFLARWADALGSAETGVATEAAQERALAEATAFAIRVDVAEELGRLATHLDEIEAILARGGEIGKRLDFLIQELHREANTLGSKSPVLELTRVAVDMKVLIEQMREQVQNIE